MLLAELVELTAHKNLKEEFQRVLAEDTAQFLSTSLAKLKNGKPVDPEPLAKVVAGLRIVLNKDYRSAITKDDAGINPNNLRELLDLLSQVPPAGAKFSSKVTYFFNAVTSFAKSIYHKDLELVKNAIAGNKQALAELSVIQLKLSQALEKLKTMAR